MKYALLALLLFPLTVLADTDTYKLVLQNHRFHPEEITIPAGKKVRILFENHDDTVDEFDSRALNREKVVTGHDKGLVNIGPLKPGRYPFQGEFHAATAQGAVIVK